MQMSSPTKRRRRPSVYSVKQKVWVYPVASHPIASTAGLHWAGLSVESLTLRGRDPSDAARPPFIPSRVLEEADRVYSTFTASRGVDNHYVVGPFATPCEEATITAVQATELQLSFAALLTAPRVTISTGPKLGDISPRSIRVYNQMPDREPVRIHTKGPRLFSYMCSRGLLTDPFPPSLLLPFSPLYLILRVQRDEPTKEETAQAVHN